MLRTCLSLVFCSILSALPVQADYLTHEKGVAFIDLMVSKHNYDRQVLETVLSEAEKKQSILDAISRPAEKTKPWHEYRKIFLTEKRIKQGVEFWFENASVLSKAEQEFGVPAQVIVAIIGVETSYGRIMGSYRVIDALTTLGFDYPKRGKFFTQQLEEFLLLTREHQKDPLDFKGSYAGAMGYGQFIPSSYRSYAKDYNGDGFADIWKNKTDAIGSVANYFKAFGWQRGKPVLAEAVVLPKHDRQLLNNRKRPDVSLKRLLSKGFKPKDDGFSYELTATPYAYDGVDGKEYMLGFNNFYVITRYNRSRLYARAVWELSEAIASSREKTALRSSQYKTAVNHSE